MEAADAHHLVPVEQAEDFSSAGTSAHVVEGRPESMGEIWAWRMGADISLDLPDNVGVHMPDDPLSGLDLASSWFSYASVQ
jgi:hypothetical protein